MGAQDQPLCREQPGGAPTLTPRVHPVAHSWSTRAWTQQSAHLSATPHPGAGQGPRRWHPGPPTMRAPRRAGMGAPRAGTAKGAQGLVGFAPGPPPGSGLAADGQLTVKGPPHAWRPDQGRGSPLADPALWKTRLLLVSSGWGAAGETGGERAPTGLQCPCSNPSPVPTLLQERRRGQPPREDQLAGPCHSPASHWSDR